MRNTIIYLIVLFSLFCPYYLKIGGPIDYEKIETLISESLLDNEKQKEKVLPILDAEIAKHPGNERLLRYRFTILSQCGLLRSAKRDADAIVGLSDDNFFRLASCALGESLGERTHVENIECYRHVFTLEKARTEKTDILHVWSAFMGELPEAESVLAECIENMGKEEVLRNDREWIIEALKKQFLPFDRKKFLRENFELHNR